MKTSKGMAMRNGRRTAFTLIEVMVALLVGALLAGAVWALFGASTRHSRGIDERLSAVRVHSSPWPSRRRPLGPDCGIGGGAQRAPPRVTRFESRGEVKAPRH
ncbi:MAG: prepilin-type N-terminal cleavage/methylation domain-containing protein, partial [Candidatus Wallbacteria bacterium]|nr:prepilin-type N-terminal cleavage/methylation domain-containing protein [Candidatus Wallbacteria bacterium]